MPVTVVATDLDRTLIYSRGALAELGDDPAPFVAVERHDGKDASWMTAGGGPRASPRLPERGAGRAGHHPHAGAVAPGRACPARPPRYAITANGGVLLVDGRPDPDWRPRSRGRAGPGARRCAEIWEHAGHVCRPEWTVKLRNAADLFCYAVLHRNRVPAGFLAEAAGWADAARLAAVAAGPQALLGAAVADQERGGGRGRAARPAAGTVLAAGDSLLDADLLDAADRGIVARHGELVASGWTAPHVEVHRRAAGSRAGEEIVAWFAAQLAAERTSYGALAAAAAPGRRRR